MILDIYISLLTVVVTILCCILMIFVINEMVGKISFRKKPVVINTLRKRSEMLTIGMKERDVYVVIDMDLQFFCFKSMSNGSIEKELQWHEGDFCLTVKILNGEVIEINSFFNK